MVSMVLLFEAFRYWVIELCLLVSMDSNYLCFYLQELGYFILLWSRWDWGLLTSLCFILFRFFIGCGGGLLWIL